MAIKVSLDQYADTMKALGNKSVKRAIGVTLNVVGSHAKLAFKKGVSKELANQTALYATGLHRKGLSIKLKIKNSKKMAVPKTQNPNMAGSAISITRGLSNKVSPKVLMKSKSHFATRVFNKSRNPVKGIFKRHSSDETKRVVSAVTGNKITVPIEMLVRLVDIPKVTLAETTQKVFDDYFDDVFRKYLLKAFDKSANF